jgi:hypothetical protein
MVAKPRIPTTLLSLLTCMSLKDYIKLLCFYASSGQHSWQSIVEILGIHTPAYVTSFNSANNKIIYKKILQILSALNFMGLRNAFIATKLGTVFIKKT